MKSRLKSTLLLCLLSLFGFAQYDSIQEVKPPSKFTEDFRITDLIERYSNLKKGKPIDGFRIQLFSGLREDANAIRKKSISSFPETACVLKYETPDYKVQMGNFRTELEAEKLLQHVRVSFPGAFIVKSKIDLPLLLIEEN